MKRSRKGISSTAAIAAIVVLVIIAAAGWAAYAAFPQTKAGSVTTVTSTVTNVNGGTGGTTTSGVTSASSPSSGSNTAAPSTYLSHAYYSGSFKIVGTTAVPSDANWFILQQTNLYKQYIPGATFTGLSGNALTQAVVTGQAQMGFIDTATVIPAIVQNATILQVATLVTIPTQWTVLVAANSSYTTLASLHGKSFGVTSVGATQYLVMLTILKQTMGWAYGTDYTDTPLGSSTAELAGLQTGTIAAEMTSLGQAYSHLIAGTFRSVYNFTLPYPVSSLFATTSFIKSNPTAVQATIEAFLAAGLAYNQNMTLGVDTIMNNFNLNRAAATFNYYQTVYDSDGSITLQGDQSAINMLLAGGGISRNVSASSIVAPGFVPIIVPWTNY